MGKLKIRASICWAAFILLSPGTVTGAGFNFSGVTDSPSRFEQRQAYRELLQLVRSGQRSKFMARRDSLRNYPLYPYLDYTEKVYYLSKQSAADINHFVEQYADTPLARRLKQKWLTSLAKRGKWKTLVANYDPSATNTEQNRCHYPYALYRSANSAEQKTRALALIDDLWLAGYSRPDACDPALKLWRSSGRLTHELAWQRFQLAMENNETDLAGYLTRFLAAEDKQAAENFRTVHRRPAAMGQTARFSKVHPRQQAMVSHGLKRLARRDVEQALELTRYYQDRQLIDPAELPTIYSDIAVRLARKPETLPRLEEIPIDLSGNQQLLETLLRTHLGALEWSNALIHLHRLDEETKSSDRWAYWRARILEQAPGSDDRQDSNQLYTSLANQRSFYGFMAADHLGLAYDFRDEPEAVGEEEVLSLEASPAMQRTFELLALGEPVQARREWNHATREFNRRELLVAAQVAKRWGWHESAIRAMIAARAWNDLGPRFPLAFQDVFLEEARRQDIPVSWSFAVARQESAFMADARSSSGALGLMQLMPATARETARYTGVRFDRDSELTVPQLNIKLGTAYLARMLRRYDHNRVLASAAYNAGPSRVDRWLNQSLPLDVWIETIPFKETRRYVQNVLLFSAIYDRLLNRRITLLYDHEIASFSGQELSLSAGAEAARR